jgi:hypothetical protein
MLIYWALGISVGINLLLIWYVHIGEMQYNRVVKIYAEQCKAMAAVMNTEAYLGTIRKIIDESHKNPGNIDKC